MASGAASRRVLKELTELRNEPPPHITIIPNEAKLSEWEVVIEGPSKPSPYNGGRFRLSVDFGLDYPFKAPMIKFKTKIYHPNIDSDGSICMGILKAEEWKPSTKMMHVLLALFDLIEVPNPDDPLVSSIAEQYRSDRPAFDRKASEMTRQYAT